ncbi:MAG: hypothetical protein GXP30_06455 [Verrucomicrobia bacterium]|nr:hypothetical protein [Verrucomicrobiota bacterium]
MKDGSQGFLNLRVSPLGMITATGVIVCLSTVFGFLSRFSWFMDLFAHFRVQYFFSLALLGIIFVMFRQRKVAAIFFAFACLNLAVILPFYFNDQNQVIESEPVLRAMLLNVNTRHGDPIRVKQSIKEIDPDFLVLEEISAKWVDDLKWLEIDYPHSVVQPREDNFGIALFSKFPLVESKIVRIGGEVPSILATVDTAGGLFRVVATHPLPPAGPSYSRRRNEQLKQLPDYINSSQALILLGDLNVTPWSYHFKKLLKQTGLIDSSKGRGVQPTWPNFFPPLQIPLDHCLHSSKILVTNREIGADVGSDHYPVIVDFVIRPDTSTSEFQHSSDQE